MKTNLPHYWTKEMPPYQSLAGWELEKKRAAEVVKLQYKFKKIDIMLNKAEGMRVAAHACHDTKNICKYCAIAIRLYEASTRIAEKLIFDYREPLYI